MSGALCLSENVFLCDLGGTYVFLDANKDQYLKTSVSQSRWISELRHASGLDNVSERAAKYSERLHAMGLTQSDSVCPTADLQRVVEPHASAYDEFRTTEKRPTLRQVLLFAAALLQVRTLERTREFRHSISAARRWKNAIQARPAPPLERVIEIADGFNALVPFFLSTHNECRFRSLLLLRYLAFFSVSVDWVYAVRTGPFGAHCWIQYEGVVLNDYLDRTQEYKVIMSL